MDLKELIESYVNDRLQKVSERFDIKIEELQSVWNDSSLPTSSKSVKSESKDPCKIDMTDLSAGRLAMCNKQELSALCKKHSKKCTGTKEELINRLLEISKPKNETSSEEKPKEEKPVKKTPPKKAERAVESKEVIRKLVSSIPVVTIRKNKWNNLEHPATRLVFNDKNTVIGKQEDDGSVAELDDEDVQNCKKYKFLYTMPKNLDKKVETKIEELDDDEDEDVVVELSEEDEEEAEGDDDDEDEEEEEEEVEEDD